MTRIHARDFVVQEVGIKRRVVRDQDRILDELQPSWRNIAPRDHRVLQSQS